MNNLKIKALELALLMAENTYDEDGRLIGANPNKVLEAAKKYYEWINNEEQK